MDVDMFALCASGDFQKLHDILEANEDDTILQKTSNDGKSLLEIACAFGRLEVINELIQFGATLDTKSERGYALSHWAAAWGTLDVLKYLLNAGVDLFGKNIHGETPREIAVRYSQMACALWLEKEESIEKLKSRTLHYKDIFIDPEKNMGRFTKDDKLTGNRCCEEKLVWLEQNREMANPEQVNAKYEELEEQLNVIISKLND